MAVNSIQMPINIKLNQNEAMSSSFGRYYLEAATSEVLSTEGLVNHITHHNCAVGTEAIAAVIKKLGECIPELVAQGQPVINLVCRAKAVDLTPEITDKSKKKWASQKCTLAEYCNAGGFPSMVCGSSPAESAGGSGSGPAESAENAENGSGSQGVSATPQSARG